MFRSLLIGILVLSTLAQSLMAPIVQLDYELRKDYIATVLCINKDKPELQCNGHCFLMENLKKAKEEQKKEAFTKKSSLVVFSQMSGFSIQFILDIVIFIYQKPIFSIFLQDGHFKKLIKPPQV